MYRADQQLPFPTDRWDQSTTNPNLPNGNDVWPPLTLPQRFPAEFVGNVVSMFRYNAQSSINKTPVHTFVYNVLSNGYFNNQEFVNWCQQAVDFAEYLHVVQNEHPQQAAEKAAKLIYRASLAVIAGNFPNVLNYIDQNTHNALIQAGHEYRGIVQDINNFRMRMQGGFQNNQFQQGGFQHTGFQHQPQTFNTGFQQPMNRFSTSVQSNVNQFSVSRSANTQPRNDGRYIDFDKRSEFTNQNQSWNASQPQQITPVNVPPASPTFNKPISDKPVPRNIHEVKIDPDYYRPVGFEVSIKRPYDVIHNPGDIEIRPAHLSTWKRTKNDHSPYPVGYDTQRFVMFHVKWPDGLVEEKLMKWEPTMEYLKHELDSEIRLKMSPEDGKIVPIETTESHLHSTTSVNVYPEIEPLVARSEMTPTEVTGLIVSSTDLENEKTARNSVMESLGINDPEQIPAHVYHSARVYPIEVLSPDGDLEKIKGYRQELNQLVDSHTLLVAKDRLMNFKRRGILSQRSIRFIDKRLTDAINYALANNLAMPELTIDSFLGDIEDLYRHLDKLDTAYVKVFDSQTPAFLKRWLTFAEAQDDENDPGVFTLMDETINFQTTWTSEQLICFNMKEGPVLITFDTHPEVLKAIMTLLNAKHKANQLGGCAVRLISKDGVYFDIIRGWLVKDAILMKLNA